MHHDTPVPRVLLLVPTTTYRAPDFVAAARSLGVEVVVGAGRRAGRWATATAGRGPLDGLRGRGSTRSTSWTAGAASTRSSPSTTGASWSRPRPAPGSASRTTRPTRSPRPATRPRCGGALAAGEVPQPAVRHGPRTAVGFPCVVKPTGLSGEPGRDPLSTTRRELDAARAADRRLLDRPGASSRSTCPAPRSRSKGCCATARSRCSRCSTSPTRSTVRTSRRRSTSRRRASRRATLARVARPRPSAAAPRIGLTEGPVHAEVRVRRPSRDGVGHRGRGALDRRALRAHAAVRRRHQPRGGDPAARARAAARRARPRASRRRA